MVYQTGPSIITKMTLLLYTSAVNHMFGTSPAAGVGASRTNTCGATWGNTALDWSGRSGRGFDLSKNWGFHQELWW